MASSLTNLPAIPTRRDGPFPPPDETTALKVPLQFGTGVTPRNNAWNRSIWASSANKTGFFASRDQHQFAVAAEPPAPTTASGSLLSFSESDAWNATASSGWSTLAPSRPRAAVLNDNNPAAARLTRSEQPPSVSDLPASSQPRPNTTQPPAPFHTHNHVAGGESRNASIHPSATIDQLASGSSSRSISATTDQRVHGYQASYSTVALATTVPAGFAMPASGPLPASMPSNGRPSNWPTQTCEHGSLPWSSSALANPPKDSVRQNHHHRPSLNPARRREDFPSDGGGENLSFHRIDSSPSRTTSTHPPSPSPGLPPQHSVNWCARPALPVDAFIHPATSGALEEWTRPPRQGTCSSDRQYTSLTQSERSSPYPQHSRHGSNVSLNRNASSAFSAVAPSHQLPLLENQLRAWRPFHPEPSFPSSRPLPVGFAYPQSAVDMPVQVPLPMNPLARPYAMPTYPTPRNGSSGANHPGRDRRAAGPDPTRSMRSPLLDDFRTNGRTSKRCELRDVFHHVVEFSGDQYGSRFIQLKLETANSDEKEQIFDEILPNAIQLMTDIFGNYVIQKLFEHGSQTQKKLLASQMKGRVLTLSLQTYGCRVVQKALEHVLVDQQVSLVGELENHVLKCVNDQNGNHVVQKVVERLPDSQIQFVIHAFQQQIPRLATHAYGCRVIQRMLEHCEDATRRSILHELHSCVSMLIVDQFGNYVIQHVIANGTTEDRRRIIAVVVSQLFAFSRHKFASNVVEKSIDHADAEQRAEILRLLTTPNHQQEHPALALVGDSYGNYVIQKVLSHLLGTERESLVERIRAHMAHLKQNHNPKQVAAIEKLIYTIDTESNPNASSQSSSLPSTNASTVEGPIDHPEPTTRNELCPSAPPRTTVTP